MTRKEWLDTATEADKQKDILDNVAAHGAIRIYGRQSLAFWGEAIDSLVDAGKVQTELKTNYEAQESYLLVTAAVKKGRKKKAG